MASKTTILSIDITADASDAAAAFDSVATSATDMGNSVDKASRVADEAGSRMAGAADGADKLDSKAAAATGSLGALSSGFELVGMEKYATGLQSAAMATDFFSGIGQGAKLLMESTAITQTKATALKIKDAVVTRAQAAATAVMTAAQWLFNAAMSANPLALVVIALVAVAVAIAVLYMKSERFREIAKAVFSAVANFIGHVIDVIKNVADWFKQKLPDAGRKMKDLIVGYVKFVTLPFRVLIDVIGSVVGWLREKLPAAGRVMKDLIVGYVRLVTAPFRLIIDVIGDLIGWVRDRLPAAWRAMKDIASGVISAVVGRVQTIISKVQTAVGWIRDTFALAWDTMSTTAENSLDAILDPIQWVIDKVQWLLDKLASIDFPSLPGWLPGIGLAGGGLTINPTGATNPATQQPTHMAFITINGAIDPLQTATQIRDVLARQSGWSGQLVPS